MIGGDEPGMAEDAAEKMLAAKHPGAFSFGWTIGKAAKWILLTLLADPVVHVTWQAAAFLWAHS